MEGITEDRFISIMDMLVKHVYGELFTLKVEKDGYIKFILPGKTFDERPKGFPFNKSSYHKFHRNLAGNLWVTDLELIRMVERMLGVSREESFKLVKDYFSKKYNLEIKYISYEGDSDE